MDLRGPGVEIRPIISMNGAHHFNEVILDDAFVPDAMVFGEIGDGWQQVTSELGFERSGPERFLSTFMLLAAARRADGVTTSFRAMPTWAAWWRASPACTRCRPPWRARWSATNPPTWPAAVVKVLGTTTEGDIAEFADLHRRPDPDSAFSETGDGRRRPASGLYPARRDQRGAARRDRAGTGDAMTARAAVDRPLVDMMNAVFAEYRETHPPTARSDATPNCGDASTSSAWSG